MEDRVFAASAISESTGPSHDSKPSRTRSAVALPCHMVRGVEGVGACLPGTSGREAWGISAENYY